MKPRNAERVRPAGMGTDDAGFVIRKLSPGYVLVAVDMIALLFALVPIALWALVILVAFNTI